MGFFDHPSSTWKINFFALAYSVLTSFSFLSNKYLVFSPALGSSQFLDPPVLFTSFDLLYLLRLNGSLEKQTTFLSLTLTGKNEWGTKLSPQYPASATGTVLIQKYKINENRGISCHNFSSFCTLYHLLYVNYGSEFLMCQSFNFRQS